MTTTDARLRDLPPPADLADSDVDAVKVLMVVDSALDEHATWLKKVHRTLVTAAAPDPRVVSDHSHFMNRLGRWLDDHEESRLLDQPIFRDLRDQHRSMHHWARRLLRKATHREPISAAEYDSFIKRVDHFETLARRVRDAFRKAVSELDPLTGMHSRHTMRAELERERERSRRTGTPFCLAMADLGHFKSVNDTYGHGVGDEVLLAVANRFLAFLRPYDTVYRFGGEEFLIALPNADDDAAATVIERLRIGLSERPLDVSVEGGLVVTCSFGICQVEADVALDEAMERADAALYAAKRTGRDRTVLWQPGMKAHVATG